MSNIISLSYPIYHARVLVIIYLYSMPTPVPSLFAVLVLEPFPLLFQNHTIQLAICEHACFKRAICAKRIREWWRVILLKWANGWHLIELFLWKSNYESLNIWTT